VHRVPYTNSSLPRLFLPPTQPLRPSLAVPLAGQRNRRSGLRTRFALKCVSHIHTLKSLNRPPRQELNSLTLVRARSYRVAMANTRAYLPLGFYRIRPLSNSLGFLSAVPRSHLTTQTGPLKSAGCACPVHGSRETPKEAIILPDEPPNCWKYPNNFCQDGISDESRFYSRLQWRASRKQERTYGHNMTAFRPCFLPLASLPFPCFPTGWVSRFTILSEDLHLLFTC